MMKELRYKNHNKPITTRDSGNVRIKEQELH